MSALASEYGATADWDQAIEPDGEPGLQSSLDRFSTPPVYSLDLQRAMVRTEPIAFLAELVDVRDDGGVIDLVFDYPGALPSIVFVLEAEKDEVDHVLSRRPGWLNQCAVVARVTSVDRPLFTATSVVEDGVERTNEAVESSVEIRSGDAVYIVKGRCVALKLVSE